MSCTMYRKITIVGPTSPPKVTSEILLLICVCWPPRSRHTFFQFQNVGYRWTQMVKVLLGEQACLCG